MDREDILARNRKENKERDLFEKEVLRESRKAGAVASMLLAFVLLTIRVILGCGIDYGLWAVCMATLAATFTVKARRLHRRHEMLIAAGYTILTLAMTAAYLSQIIASATRS